MPLKERVGVMVVDCFPGGGGGGLVGGVGLSIRVAGKAGHGVLGDEVQFVTVLNPVVVVVQGRCTSVKRVLTPRSCDRYILVSEPSSQRSSEAVYWLRVSWARFRRSQVRAP